MLHEKMLKLAIGLLFVLHFTPQIVEAKYEKIYSSPNFKKATANVTTKEEWKEVNATLDYIHYLIVNKPRTMEKFSFYGQVLMNEKVKLRVLNTIPKYHRWVEHSHLELCKSDFFNSTPVTQLSVYNQSMIDKYRQFLDVLKTVPIDNLHLNLKKIKKYMSYKLDESVLMQGAISTEEFIDHLDCLVILNGALDKTWLNNITEVYETFLYWKKREEQRALPVPQRPEESPEEIPDQSYAETPDLQRGSSRSAIKWFFFAIGSLFFIYIFYLGVKEIARTTMSTK